MHERKLIKTADKSMCTNNIKREWIKQSKGRAYQTG